MWTFSEFDKFTKSTDQCKSLWYYALGLAGETGELIEWVKKHYRSFLMSGVEPPLTEQQKEDMTSEIGDVLWYLSRLAASIGITLDETVDYNVRKLRKRAAEGTLLEKERHP